VTTFIVDGDVRRRAQISYEMNRLGVCVMPFDDVAELNGRWPEQAFILIEDRNDNLDRLRALMRAQSAWVPFVAYSEAPKTAAVVSAMSKGAVDYVDEPGDIRNLCQAIERALNQSSPTVERHRRSAKARSLIGQLTARERDVLTALAEGLCNRKIGKRLGISPRTVEIHRSNMMTKLGARGVGEAVRMEIEALLP
jgi:FixJ family two-component response regulator